MQYKSSDITGGKNGTSSAYYGRFGTVSDGGTQYIDANGTQIRMEGRKVFSYDEDDSMSYHRSYINSTTLFEKIRANPISSYPDGTYSFAYVVDKNGYIGTEYGRSSFNITISGGAVTSASITITGLVNAGYSNGGTLYILNCAYSG